MKANIRLLLTIIAVSAIIFACLLRPTEVTVSIAVLTRIFVVSAGIMTVIRDWPKPNWMVLGFVVCSMVSFLALDRASYSTPMFRETIIKIYGLDLGVDPTEDFNQYVRVTTQAFHLIFSLTFGIVVSFAIPFRQPAKH